jgi:hypothetical protein
VDNDVGGRLTDKQHDVAAAIRRHVLALERHPKLAPDTRDADRQRREKAFIDEQPPNVGANVGAVLLDRPGRVGGGH